MKIAVVGTGYVGLVTGICFSEMGNEVWCVDVNENKINSLREGIPPIYETGLEAMLKENIRSRRLSFTTDISVVKNCRVVFIAVGTPRGEDGSADLRYVYDVAEQIGKHMENHMFVVDKSTVPVGTAEQVKLIIQKELNKRNSDLKFDVISNPEFLKEGTAINDCMRPDRIVIGADSDNAVKIMKEIYTPFIKNTETFIIMDIKSAEMTKYAANAMLATKISFMNEIANICEKVGADVNKIRKGIGSDTRIGYHFIYAGCGYGGSCFPKDVQALIKTSLEFDYVPKILSAVEHVNIEQKYVIVKKVKNKFGENLEGKTFGVWGLAFKPDTDDMREASAITIINELTKLGAKIKAYDPKAMEEAREIYLKENTNVEYLDSKYDTLNNSDAMILITDWKEFRSPDFDEMKRRMKSSIIFDGRNQYDENVLTGYGFEYYQIGVGR